MNDLARTLALDETRIGYHFVGATLRDGRPVPPDREWLVHEGDATLCESGLHASRHPSDALSYAPGATLCLVECEEIVSEQDDKFVCRRRRILARIDATALLWRVSREYARAALPLWDAPTVVREYLETGDESKRAAAWAAAWAAVRAAAWGAARDAAKAAAWAAARDAAWTAAWAAARDAQRAIFQRLVDEAFAAVAKPEAA